MYDNSENPHNNYFAALGKQPQIIEFICHGCSSRLQIALPRILGIKNLPEYLSKIKCPKGNHLIYQLSKE